MVKKMISIFHAVEQYIPIAAWLFITTTIAFRFLLFSEENRLYELLGELSGVGLLFTLIVLDKAFKEEWHNYSIGCLFGLAAYCLVNTAYVLWYFWEPDVPDDDPVLRIYIAFSQCVALMGATCFGVLYTKHLRRSDAAG